jgi:predicted Zn-dependent protease
MKFKQPFVSLVSAALISSLFLSCHKNAVTGRSSMTLVSETEMIGMSETEYSKFLSQHPPLPDSDSRVLLVRKVGSRIQQSVEKYYADKNLSSELKDFKWEFNVVDENTVNAWCMPGGKVVFYTGIMPLTQDEKGLAVVMGHEVAHAIARHGTERMSQGLLVQVGGAILSVALQSKPALTRELFGQAYGLTTGLGILKYSRNHESEADKMGLVFMAMAGYDPQVAIPFWERMAAQSKGEKPPEFLSTHPSDETRINDLKQCMGAAMQFYKPQ